MKLPTAKERKSKYNAIMMAAIPLAFTMVSIFLFFFGLRKGSEQLIPFFYGLWVFTFFLVMFAFYRFLTTKEYYLLNESEKILEIWSHGHKIKGIPFSDVGPISLVHTLSTVAMINYSPRKRMFYCVKSVMPPIKEGFFKRVLAPVFVFVFP